MEKNLKIKSLDELRKVAIDNDDLENHVKLLIKETEQKIIEGIQTGLSIVIIPVLHGDYHLLTYTHEDSSKIMIYNLLKVLQQGQYKLKLKRLNTGFHIIVDISNCSGNKITSMLNDYLNQFL